MGAELGLAGHGLTMRGRLYIEPQDQKAVKELLRQTGLSSAGDLVEVLEDMDIAAAWENDHSIAWRVTGWLETKNNALASLLRILAPYVQDGSELRLLNPMEHRIQVWSFQDGELHLHEPDYMPPAQFITDLGDVSVLIRQPDNRRGYVARYGVWGELGRGKPEVFDMDNNLEWLLDDHHLTTDDVATFSRT